MLENRSLGVQLDVPGQSWALEEFYSEVIVNSRLGIPRFIYTGCSVRSMRAVLPEALNLTSLVAECYCTSPTSAHKYLGDLQE